MDLTPSFADFARAYEAGENQVVYAKLAADMDTPVSLMLKMTGAARDAFMLESVTGGEVRGRYSIIGMKPDVIWQCHGTASRINRLARFDGDAFMCRVELFKGGKGIAHRVVKHEAPLEDDFVAQLERKLAALAT